MSSAQVRTFMLHGFENLNISPLDLDSTHLFQTCLPFRLCCWVKDEDISSEPAVSDDDDNEVDDEQPDPVAFQAAHSSQIHVDIRDVIVRDPPLPKEGECVKIPLKPLTPVTAEYDIDGIEAVSSPSDMWERIGDCGILPKPIPER